MTDHPTPRNRGGRPRKPLDLKLAKATIYLLPPQVAALSALTAETGLSGPALLRAALEHLLAARALGK